MRLLEILKYKFPNGTPQSYGLFHILCILVILTGVVLFTVFFKDADDKKFRKMLLVVWLVLIFIELYKEFTYRHDWHFDENGKLINVTYTWSLFPFQFCSTSFYTLPLVIFLPNGKVRNAVMAYISTFVMFAGLLVTFVPNDVFVPQIGICIQTMIQHGLQLAIGILITVRNREKLVDFRSILKYLYPGIIVFACMASIAISLNEIVYHTNIANGETFNMFFISKHYPCTLLILSGIYSMVPYGVFLVIYLVGFTLVAFIMIMSQIGGIKLASYIKSKKNAKTA